MAGYPLSKDWTRIASAGQTVELQNPAVAAVIVMTAVGGPPPTPDGIMLAGSLTPARYALTKDLYARCPSGAAATLQVLDGFTLGASGAASPSVTTPSTTPAAPAATLDLSQGSALPLAL